MNTKTKYPPVKELRKFYDQLQTKIMTFVVETSESDTPLMTKIIVNLDGVDEEKAIVLLWATANLAESPLYRIEQLKEENRRLEAKLSQMLK